MYKLTAVYIGTDITDHEHVLDNDKPRAHNMHAHCNCYGINKIFQPMIIFCSLIRRSIILLMTFFIFLKIDFDLIMYNIVYHSCVYKCNVRNTYVLCSSTYRLLFIKSKTHQVGYLLLLLQMKNDFKN